MGVLHRATGSELTAVIGAKLARLVVGAREGTLVIEAGGGGAYGKVIAE
jgi:PHP family Zn ribbon phosphoesterase